MNVKSFFPFTNLFSGMVSPRKEGKSTFYLMHGQQVDMPFRDVFAQAQGIPHLGAVVDKGSEMFSAVQFKICKTNTEEEEIDTKHVLNERLREPNKLQTWKQLLYITYTYKILCGAAFLYPGFGISRKPSNLAYLSAIDFETYTKRPKYNVSSITNPGVDDIIDTIDFYFKYTKAISLKPSALMWVKDRFVNFIDDHSRVVSLEKNLENIYKTLVARGVLIDKRGGIGMIAGSQKDSGMSVPLKPSEKKKLRAAVNDHNLSSSGQSIMVTDVPLKYTPFVFPTRELMLFEEIADDFDTICDRLGINRELFDNQTTFANKKMAETSTYINTIVPAWTDFFNLLNKELNTRAENIIVLPDWTHVEALQKSRIEEITADAAMSTMLLNELDRELIDKIEYRQQMGYEN